MRILTSFLVVAGLCTCGLLSGGCSQHEGSSTSVNQAVQEETMDLPGAEAETTMAVREELEASDAPTSVEAAEVEEDLGSKTATQSSEAAAEQEASQAAD